MSSVRPAVCCPCDCGSQGTWIMYGTRVPSSHIVLFSHMFCTTRVQLRDDETSKHNAHNIIGTHILAKMPAVVGVDDDNG